MFKRYTFWLWVAVVFQLLNATIHSLSLIRAPVGTNSAEIQMFDLMVNHQLDLGAGIHRSMWDLFRALSSCYTLLCLLAAFTNIFVLRKKVEPGVVKGLVGIQLVVFATGFVVMVALTFLPPIILTGVVVLFLAISYFTTPRSSLVGD
jgi:hypothetical protein